MFQPVIKWSGSKRSQSSELIKLFPNSIDTYYEPFCGGCSMLRSLLESNIKVNNYICSDINKDLINLWNEIKYNPSQVILNYDKHWDKLNETDDRNLKRKYFEEIRSIFNETHNPFDFMFIMRTTTNGMPRYNKNGEFNNSFHITRDGIRPDKLAKIVIEWSNLLNNNDVSFVNADYSVIFNNAKKGDFLYLDPPYANTKGMYYGSINKNSFFQNIQYLNDKNVKWVLSYDGISGDIDNTYNVPPSLYMEHKYIKSGNSSFKRTIGKSNDSIVYESVYRNFIN